MKKELKAFLKHQMDCTKKFTSEVKDFQGGYLYVDFACSCGLKKLLVFRLEDVIGKGEKRKAVGLCISGI